VSIQVKSPEAWDKIRNRKSINIPKKNEDGINMFYFLKTRSSMQPACPNDPPPLIAPIQ